MDRTIDAEDPAPHGGVPFRTVLASVLGLWLCYFLLSTIRAHLMDFGFAEETLWRRALACGLGVAITLALWLVLRLFDHRPLPVKIVAALLLSLPVLAALAQSNRLVFQPLEHSSSLSLMIAALAASIILQQAATIAWGSEPRTTPSPRSLPPPT